MISGAENIIVVVSVKISSSTYSFSSICFGGGSTDTKHDQFRTYMHCTNSQASIPIYGQLLL